MDDCSQDRSLHVPEEIVRSPDRRAIRTRVIKLRGNFGQTGATTWLRPVLRDRMEQALSRNRTDGWYRSEVIERMWREHLSGRDDHRRALWNFLFSFPFQAR